MVRKGLLAFMALFFLQTSFTYGRWSCQSQLSSQIETAVWLYEYSHISDNQYTQLLEMAADDYLGCIAPD